MSRGLKIWIIPLTLGLSFLISSSASPQQGMGQRNRQQINPQPIQFQNNQQNNRTQQTNRQTLQQVNTQPSGAYYNQDKPVQFYSQLCSPPNEPVHNGGIGNGGNGSYRTENGGYAHVSGPLPYFCGGRDESNAYQKLMGNTNVQTLTEDIDKGTYQFHCLVDSWEIEPHANVSAEGSFFLFGAPTHATNCHPFGWRSAWDDIKFETVSNINSEMDEWEMRNSMGDNFRYGRYLLKKTGQTYRLNTPAESNHIGAESGVYLTYEFPDDAAAILPGMTPVDIPYGSSDLTYGFTCPKIMRGEGYKKIEKMNIGSMERGSSEWHLERERLCHYRMLLKQAVDRLGHEISEGVYGLMTAPRGHELTTSEKLMREIVVNSWNILDEMTNQLEGRTCDTSGSGFQRAVRTFQEAANINKIEFWACPVARNTHVECKEDDKKCCILPGIAQDCQSKRSIHSHAAYNVRDCTPSYGFRGYQDVILETNFQTTNGWDVIMGTSDGVHAMMDTRVADASNISAGGYDWAIIDPLAHELIHAYFQKHLDINRMDDWPALESSWEERLAIMGEALIHRQLCALGYAPCDFGMDKTEFIRDVQRQNNRVDGTITGVTRGYRFSYPAECRGYGEKFIGPYCTNMLNLAKLLEQQDPETASMMAQIISTAPFLNPPDLMTINGYEQPFAFPEVEGILMENGTLQQQNQQQMQMQQHIQQQGQRR